MNKNIPDDVKNYLMEAHQLAGEWSLPNNRGNHENSQSIPLKSIGVIGGGTMGRGIAIAFCLAGYETVLIELNEKAVEFCRKELEITYAREKVFKRLNDQKIEKLRKTLKITTDFQELKGSDLIIEAVFEDMKLKKELFTKLDNICKETCIFGTNTSSLDLDEMSSVLRDPTKVVGIHFFNPANLIKMVEVIFGSKTSSKAVATAFEACRGIKKLAVLVGNCPAFVFNRLLAVYLNQSQKLMYQYGYLPQQIDKMITSMGFLMGPLTVADMNGLDVMEKLKKEQGWPCNPFEEEMWRRKRYGRKTNKGYYKYDPITHKKENDMEMEQLIREVSYSAKPNIQILNEQDAINFLLYPMVNEGFLCIEEGIIHRENLIDIMFILGFGWPIPTGGPMRFGRSEGIEKVASTIIHWSSLEPTDRVYKKKIMENGIISQGVANITPLIRSALTCAKNGDSIEVLTTELSRQIENEWTNLAREYAERVDAQRRADRELHEKQVEALKNALNAQHRDNIQLRVQFSQHLIQIRTVLSNHAKFENMRVETFIQYIGQFFSSLNGLLLHHEDVEFATDNREFLETMRDRSALEAIGHHNQLTDHLNENISHHLPLPSICARYNEIFQQITEIQETLNSLHSKIGFVTPEYWNESDVNEISHLKGQLQEQSNSLVQMIEESEAAHKATVQGTMQLPDGLRHLGNQLL